MSRDGKWIYAQFDSKCAECDSQIFEGDRIGFTFLDRAALCGSCAEEALGPDPFAAFERME